MVQKLEDGYQREGKAEKVRLTNEERNKLLKQFTGALLVFTVLNFVFFVSRTFFALYFT